MKIHVVYDHVVMVGNRPKCRRDSLFTYAREIYAQCLTWLTF